MRDRVDRLQRQNQVLRERWKALSQENRRIEKAFKEGLELLKGFPGAVLLIQEGKIILAGDRALDDLGYSEQEVLGKDLQDFLDPRSENKLRGLYSKKPYGKSILDQKEVRMITKHGESLSYEVYIKRIKYQGRIAFLVNLVDLGQRHQREALLIQSRKTEAIVRLASGLNQEIQDWLNIIDEVNLSIDRNGMLRDSASNQYMKGVKTVRDKGQCILEKLKTISQAEGSPSRRVKADLKGVIQNAVALARKTWEEDIEAHDGEINIKTFLRTISGIIASPEDVQHVLVIIILNAMDALVHGGDIYVTAEEDSESVRIYIQDNGVGIQEDIRDKVLDPFFTAKQGSRKGLGLSVAQAKVHKHGGHIEFMSKEGQGTTFAVTFPVWRDANLIGRKRATNRIKDSHSLIIADEGLVKYLVSQLLVSKGGRVTAVSTGAEALKLMKKTRFDLVVADSNRSHIEHSKVIRRIRSRDPGLPIMMINAVRNIESERTLRESGADLVLGKPLNMDSILVFASNLLSMRGDQPQ
jgi:PAS domain S-box-containing protein